MTDMEEKDCYTKYQEAMAKECRKLSANCEKEVIEGFIARNKDGELNFFELMPRRLKYWDRYLKNRDFWIGGGRKIDLSDYLLCPNLTWDSEPHKARIEITLLDEEK